MLIQVREIHRIVEHSGRYHGSPPVVEISSDLCRDFDEPLTMVVLKELHRLGAIRIQFVANLSPAEKRSQLGRGMLDEFGPVCIARNGDRNAVKQRLAILRNNGRSPTGKGTKYLWKAYERAREAISNTVRGAVGSSVDTMKCVAMQYAKMFTLESGWSCATCSLRQLVLDKPPARCGVPRKRTCLFLMTALVGPVVATTQDDRHTKPQASELSGVEGTSTTAGSMSSKSPSNYGFKNTSSVKLGSTSWDSASQVMQLLGNSTLIVAICGGAFCFYRGFCTSEKRLFDKERKRTLLALLVCQYIYHRIEADNKAPLGLPIGLWLSAAYFTYQSASRGAAGIDEVGVRYALSGIVLGVALLGFLLSYLQATAVKINWETLLLPCIAMAFLLCEEFLVMYFLPRPTLPSSNQEAARSMTGP